MESEEEPAMSQRSLVAADQYGLQRLKLMCEHRLSSLIDRNSVEDILHLAEKHRCAALKEACFDFIGSTETLVPARERLLQVRETEELRFDRLIIQEDALTSVHHSFVAFFIGCVHPCNAEVGNI
jgi:speckle-type POZ protein